MEHIPAVEEINPDAAADNDYRVPRPSWLRARLPPAIFAERSPDLLLPSQSNHQTERLLHRLPFGGLSGHFLGFGHQLIVDFDIGTHWCRSVRCGGLSSSSSLKSRATSSRRSNGRFPASLTTS
jgi:hypothetical protein